MWKPGERVPREGTYYCYVCALRGETVERDYRAAELFVECSSCLARKVPEWDLTWKARGTPDRGRAPRPWPGSLGPQV
jgi:hypothetical protein